MSRAAPKQKKIIIAEPKNISPVIGKNLKLKKI